MKEKEGYAMFRQRQRIHNRFMVFALFVFCLIGALALPRPVSAADGLTVEAVQGNISGHRLKMSKGDKVTLVVKSGGAVVSRQR